MAVDFSEGFESGLPGNNITNVNTAFNQGQVGGGVATFDTSQFAHGQLAAKLVNSANTVTLNSSITATQSRTMRRYVRLDSIPTGTNSLIFHSVRLGAGAALGVLRLISSGKIQMRDATTTTATSVGAMSANQWWRYEWQLNGAGTAQQLLLFYGSNWDGDTPDETLTGSYSGGNFDTVVSGINSGTQNYNLWLDDCTDDTALVTIGSARPATSQFIFTHSVTIG